MVSLKSITLVEQIVDSVVKAACDGRFRLGERVIEAEVARELGVSRVPVREALRLLESQGIVVNSPHRGMRLMTVDAKDLRQILIVRSSLERLAAPAAAAALRGDKRARQNLSARLTVMAQAARRGDSFELAQADTAFHRTMCGLAENDVLLQLWETLARRLTIIFGITTRNMDLRHVHRTHVVLVQTLVKGDPGEIDRSLDAHIMEAADFADLSAVSATAPDRDDQKG
jgi:DNA-binding GntR family transcriptional regulator